MGSRSSRAGPSARQLSPPPGLRAVADEARDQCVSLAAGSRRRRTRGRKDERGRHVRGPVSRGAPSLWSARTTGAFATRRRKPAVRGSSGRRRRRSGRPRRRGRRRACRRRSLRNRGRSGTCAPRLVGDPHVVAVDADDPNVVRAEPCLDPEGASRSTLTGEAVAHGDPDGVAFRRQAKLSTATGCVAGRHRGRS
jgi:hypothetical protein